MMQGFNGFPDGKIKPLSVPALFFSELLPLIDDFNELKVTMYCFWALNQQDSAYRYVRLREVLNDERFMQGLKINPSGSEHTLRNAFERAVARGTLLHVTLYTASGEEEIYFINTEKGRSAVDALEQGDWIPGDEQRPIELVVERPNVFVVYEQNIGPITPLIAEQLMDAEKTYSRAWILEAIQIAAENHVRSLRYILKILEKWSTKGKQHYGTSRRSSQESVFAHLEEDYSDTIN